MGTLNCQVVNPKKTYGPAADIWSLGCTVLEMLTRELPYPDLEWLSNQYYLLQFWITVLVPRGLLFPVCIICWHQIHMDSCNFFVQTQALYRIGKGEPPAIPSTLSREARDFISKCVKPNPEDRPSASKLLDHPFVNRSIRSVRSMRTSSRPNSSTRGVIG
jgi:mitogen-activated protein kinase kinase kinase 1